MTKEEFIEACTSRGKDMMEALVEDSGPDPTPEQWLSFLTGIIAGMQVQIDELQGRI